MAKKKIDVESALPGGGISNLIQDTTENPDRKELEGHVRRAEAKKRGDKPKRGPGRPRTNFKEVEKSSEEGTIEGETRATFIIKKDLLESLKALAYWERSQIKDVANEAIQLLLESRGEKTVEQAKKLYEKNKKK